MRIYNKIADHAGLPPHHRGGPSERISVSLTPQQMTMLREEAKGRRMQLSGLIRKIVAAHIDASPSSTDL